MSPTSPLRIARKFAADLQKEERARLRIETARKFAADLSEGLAKQWPRQFPKLTDRRMKKLAKDLEPLWPINEPLAKAFADAVTASCNSRRSTKYWLTSDGLFGDFMPTLLQTYWPGCPLDSIVDRKREGGPYLFACRLIATALGVDPPDNAEQLHGLRRRVQDHLARLEQQRRRAMRERRKEKQRNAELDRQEAQRIEASLGGKTIFDRVEEFLRGEKDEKPLFEPDK